MLDIPLICTECNAKHTITRSQLVAGAPLPCPHCGHTGEPLDVDTVNKLHAEWDKLDAAHGVLGRK